MLTALIVYLYANGAVLMYVPIFIDKIKDDGVLLKHVLMIVIFFPAIITVLAIRVISYTISKIYRLLLPILNKRVFRIK